MAKFFESITEGVSVPLTRLASGYRPQGLINEQVFPVAKSILKAGKIPIFGKDAFKIYQTLRARTAKSNRAQIEADSWISFACEEHDLAIPMDQNELDELNAIPGDQQLKALFSMENRQRQRVQWNMALQNEKNVADLVQATANYTHTNYVSLTNSDCWSETGSDPVTNIEDGKEVIRQNIGIYPNTLVLGGPTYDKLKFHAKYTAKMASTKDLVVSPEFIKEIHNLDRVIIGQSMGVDSAGAFYDLWGDFALLCYIPRNDFPDLFEPSFGYTIRPSFSPKPFPYVDIFTEEGGKIVNVRCTDMYDQIFTMDACGYLIKNTVK